MGLELGRLYSLVLSKGGIINHVRGLWIWKTVLKREVNGEPVSVIVMDSEGLQSEDNEENFDVKIFSLVILLSSNFIYNSMSGAINQGSIDALELVVQIANDINTTTLNSEANLEQCSQYFPSLLWIGRDFSLELVDDNGEPITENEYLEFVLRTKKSKRKVDNS
jgi:hypothetical protein